MANEKSLCCLRAGSEPTVWRCSALENPASREQDEPLAQAMGNNGSALKKKKKRKSFTCSFSWPGDESETLNVIHASVCLLIYLYLIGGHTHNDTVLRSEDRLGSGFSPSTMWYLGTNSEKRAWWQVISPTPFLRFFNEKKINFFSIISTQSLFWGPRSRL